jgi:phosphoketolase
MLQTLDALKFLVTHPEPGIPEDVHGAVITALNEEAVAAAAMANKGGINIIVTYEAFGAKMHGVVRQEVIFAKHCKEAGQPPRWLSVPLVLTSHTWENAKNEQSHQDPVMAEAMLGEPSDVSRVIFVPDYNSAVAVMRGVYQTQGQVWTLVIPKYDSVPELFSPDEVSQLLQDGAIRVAWAGYDVARQQVVLTAIGAYQLEQALRASVRLKDRGVPHSVVCMLEPGRFRFPRSDGESAHEASVDVRAALYPNQVPARVFVTHTRPETILGVLQPLNTGAGRTVGLGFTGQGGTLTTPGMLFLNRCTWAHILLEVAELLSLPLEKLLDPPEQAAVSGRLSPEGIVI